MVKKYLNTTSLIKALLLICISHNCINAMCKHSSKFPKWMSVAPKQNKRNFSSWFKLPQFAQPLSNLNIDREADRNIYESEDKNDLLYNSTNSYKFSNEQMARFERIALDDCIEDRTEISEALIEIENGIRPWGRNHKIDRALIRASALGNKELVQFFIGAGADINYKGINGETALMMAVYHHQTEIFETLLRSGADINAQDNTGETILMISRYHYDEAITKWLILHGADVDAKDQCGRTAIMRAAWDNWEDSMKFAEILIKAANADINAQDNDGNTALIIAGLSENVPMVQLLLKFQASIYIGNKKNETVFMAIINNLIKNGQAENRDHQQILKMILDQALNS